MKTWRPPTLGQGLCAQEREAPHRQIWSAIGSLQSLYSSLPSKFKVKAPYKSQRYWPAMRESLRPSTSSSELCPYYGNENEKMRCQYTETVIHCLHWMTSDKLKIPRTLGSKWKFKSSSLPFRDQGSAESPKSVSPKLNWGWWLV